MGLEVSEHTIFSACYRSLGLRVRFLQGQSAEVMFVPSGKTLFKQSRLVDSFHGTPPDTLIHAWGGLTAVVYGRMQHECVHSPVSLHAEL